MRLPSYEEHQRFCDVDGWTLGRQPRKHYTYTKVLPDGELLRTTISKGRGGYTSPQLWSRILRHQLQVTEEQFWLAVDQGVPPDREVAEAKPQGESIPWNVVDALLKAGCTEEALGKLTKQEAIDLWHSYLTKGELPEQPG